MQGKREHLTKREVYRGRLVCESQPCFLVSFRNSRSCTSLACRLSCANLRRKISNQSPPFLPSVVDFSQNQMGRSKISRLLKSMLSVRGVLSLRAFLILLASKLFRLFWPSLCTSEAMAMATRLGCTVVCLNSLPSYLV